MDEVTLTYLLAHPGSLGLGAERPLLALGALAAVAFFLVPVPGAARSAAALRALAFACVVASLAGLGLTASLPADELTLVAAVDVSGSIDDDAVRWSDDYLRSLRSALAPGDQLAVVSFAATPSIISTATEGGDPPPIMRPRDIAATDIAAAIDQALTLYPERSQRALLLLSDGNETSGDSRSRIETLRALSVRVDAVTPPRGGTADVRVARMSAPAIVAAERPLPLRVVIRNSGGARAAVLNLYLDGRLSDSVALALDGPLQTVDALLRVPHTGGHVIRAEIVSDGDEQRQNDSRELSVMVRGETRVLLATRHRYSPLGEILRRRGIELTITRPERLPSEVSGYASTHLVVFEDLAARDVSKPAAAALERFVEARGGGLIFAGGSSSFGDQGFHGTVFERMLPVTLEPRRPRPGKRDPLALFLVIDRSNSMGFNSRIGTVRDGEKLRYALKAGVAVIRQLKDHDRVGVIAFDSRAHEVAPLRPLKTNRQLLLDALPRIVESGGTDFFDALKSAGTQLAASRVSRKHVVLLTDGDTNRADRGEYRALIADLASAGISVTTIRIGDNTVNLRLLQDISEGTGGSFHHVEDAQMLPDLMLRDTSQALRPLTPQSQRFFPAVAAEHGVLAGTEEGEIPPLADYAFSKAKPDSETLLHVARSDRRDPILSLWRYGLGRVVAFTASPREDAEAWPGWDGFTRFWSQIVFWAARSESDDDLAVEASRQRDATRLLVRTFDREDPPTVLAGDLDTGGGPLPVAFSPREPGLYEATTEALPPGRYPMRLRKRSGDEIREIDTVVAVPAQRDDERKEYDRGADNEELLRELTKRTGGTFSASTRDITERPTGSRSSFYPLAGILIPLAMLSLLADVALRRLAPLRARPLTSREVGPGA